ADLAERTSTGDGERAAILLAAVDPVGIPVIGGDLVDLGRLLVVPRAPGSTAVETDRRPLIPTVHDMAWIGRIDPPLVRVVAPGGSFEGNQGATPIGGSVDTGTHCVDDIRITRVDQDLFARCINRPRRQRPTGAAVIRPEKTRGAQQIDAP